MTVVSHEREPGELGFVARYTQARSRSSPPQVRADPERYGAEQVRDLGWAIVEAEMLRLHVCRRLSDRLDGISHGPGGLGRQAAHDRRSSRRSATPRCPSAAPATAAATTPG